MTNTGRNILSRTALLIVAIVWGSSLVVVSGTSGFFKPNFLLGLRFGLAFLLLCIIFFKQLKSINKDYLVNGGIVGFFFIHSLFRADVRSNRCGGTSRQERFFIGFVLCDRSFFGLDRKQDAAR